MKKLTGRTKIGDRNLSRRITIKLNRLRHAYDEIAISFNKCPLIAGTVNVHVSNGAFEVDLCSNEIEIDPRRRLIIVNLQFCKNDKVTVTYDQDLDNDPGYQVVATPQLNTGIMQPTGNCGDHCDHD